LSTTLRMLQVEDSESDAAIVVRLLQRAGYEPRVTRVESAGEMRKSLGESVWDIILSDYRLPGFDAPAALRVLHETGLDIPFIVISGTIGEDVAVEVMKSGAHDYLMKSNLTRLVQAVEREIREAEVRKAGRLAQQALQESNLRLTMALAGTRMGVWEWNLRTGNIFWSPECYQAIGVESFDGSFDTLLQAVHPDDRQRLQQEVEQIVTGHRGVATEYRAIRPSGEVVWLANCGHMEYDASGKPLRVIGTVQDITERKCAEAALQHSQAMLQSVVASALDAVIVMSGQGIVALWNVAAERMFGYTADEAIGKPLHELIAPASVHSELQVGMAGFRMSGEGSVVGQTREMVARRKDGSEFLVELSVAPVSCPGTWQAVGVVRDITERKRAELALRESEQRWQFALEGSGDGVWDWDVATNTAYHSRQDLALLNLEGSELPYQRRELEERIHPDDRERFVTVWERHLAGVTPSYACEYRLRSADGTYKWILGRGKAIARDTEGRPLRVIGTHTDLTALKTAEAEREKLRAQFLQAQKMESIGRLAGGVAHDFNNLLTVINGYSGLALKQLGTGDPLRETVEEIYRAGERATGLVRQLLAFSRTQVLKQEYLDVNELIGDMQRMVRRLMREDVEIVTRLTPSLDAVQADRHQMEQAILNLAINARDAMPHGGTVTIETGRERREGTCAQCHINIVPGMYVRITIRDTGTGIGEDARQHMFEPFFTTKEVGQGTGLGLATVQGIVIQSGGHISFESALNEGTAFHIYLPAVERKAPEELETAVAALPARGHETVLLVEDQSDVRRFCVRVLENRGYRVMQAPGGEAALLLLGTRTVDLLITDLIMPQVNGRELAERARLMQPRIRVLFISGYSGDTLAGYEEQVSAQTFIQKPFDAQSLAEKVRAVLDEPPPAAPALG
jgi:two-component system, cell cycle sensor histidine kinase and response regulator CckA